MKALFLAGGMGTRLRPLTNHLPKPMVPLMNRPILERSIKKLRDCGIREIVLSTCYQPERIRRYFGSGEKFGVSIQYIKEDIPLGTGGAIKNAARYFDDTFLIFNADILCDLDVRKLVRFHRQKRASVTIAVTRVANPTAYGVIEYDRNLYATKFTEKPKPEDVRSHYINAGLYVFEPQVMNEIASGRPVSIEREVFPTLLQKGCKVAVYDGCSYWMDIGTPEKYLRAHRDAFAGKYRIPELEFHRAPGGQAWIDPTARIVEPVCFGKNVVVGPNAVVGPYTVLGNCCRIGSGATVRNCVLWDHVNVRKGAVLNRVAIPSGETVPIRPADTPLCIPLRPGLTENESGRHVG